METIILITVLSTLGVVTLVTTIVVAFTRLNNKVDKNTFDQEITNLINHIEKLNDIRLSLKDEIITIDNELLVLNSKGITSVKDPDISKLRNLKKECILHKMLNTEIV